MTFYEDSLQSIVAEGRWWIKQDDVQLCRGALVNAFVPHFDQTPYAFEPLGRSVATEHGKATVKVSPLKISQPLKQIQLPVAAMPQLHHNEVFAAYRAKPRYCLVLSNASYLVDANLTRGKPKNATAPTVLVAPYYGATPNSKRAGFGLEFVEGVRHCRWPQFIWDKLPIPNGEESILRIDQLQPIGAHYHSYKLCGFKLSDQAMEVVDDVFKWFISGAVPEDSDLQVYKALVESFLPTDTSNT